MTSLLFRSSHEIVTLMRAYLDEWLIPYWYNPHDSGYTFILPGDLPPGLYEQLLVQFTYLFHPLPTQLVLDDEGEVFKKCRKRKRA